MVINRIDRMSWSSLTCVAIGLCGRVSTKYQAYVCYIYVTWILGTKVLGGRVHFVQKVCGRRPPPSTSDYRAAVDSAVSLSCSVTVKASIRVSCVSVAVTVATMDKFS